MIVKPKLVKALNEQVRNELSACLQYIAIAAYFDQEGLPDTAGFFYQQADEERMHAMKIVRYLLDAGGKPLIPGIPEVLNDFGSAEEAVKYALDQEIKVTGDFDHLVGLSLEEKDHTTNSFLQWFVTEQVEEVASMTNLLQIVRRAGNQLLFVEEYVRRNGHVTASGTPAGG